MKKKAKVKAKSTIQSRRSAAMKAGWETRRLRQEQSAHEKVASDQQLLDIPPEANNPPIDRDTIKRIMHGLTYGMLPATAALGLRKALSGEIYADLEAPGKSMWAGFGGPPKEPKIDVQVEGSFAKDGYEIRHYDTRRGEADRRSSNPKDAVSGDKVPNFSVIPPTSLIYQGLAMRYGAYLAKRKDGGRGYGPFNWRDQPVVAGIYSDAAVRHIMAWLDGEDVERIYDDETGELIAEVPHLGAALASLGILADAFEHSNLIDNRPKVRRQVASALLKHWSKAK